MFKKFLGLFQSGTTDHAMDEAPLCASQRAPQGQVSFCEAMHAQWAVDVIEPRKKGIKYNCPCCGCNTLNERGGYDICPVCFWEDDGQDSNDADTDRGFGPNHISLLEGRANYLKFGACDEQSKGSVRLPYPHEVSLEAKPDEVKV